MVAPTYSIDSLRRATAELESALAVPEPNALEVWSRRARYREAARECSVALGIDGCETEEGRSLRASLQTIEDAFEAHVQLPTSRLPLDEVHDLARELRREVQRLHDDQNLAEWWRARLLSRWRVDLQVIEEAARLAGFWRGAGELMSLISECGDIVHAGRRLRERFDERTDPIELTPEVRDKLRESESCSTQVTTLQVLALARWVRDLSLEDTDPATLRRALAKLNALQLDLALLEVRTTDGTLQGEIDRTLEELITTRHTLRDAIFDRAFTVSPREALEFFVPWLRENLDATSDLLSTLEEIEPDEAVRALEITVERLESLRRELDARPLPPLPREPERELQTRRDPIKALRRGLDRMHADVRSELMEKRLAWRLESQFGRRNVTWFENLIFILIFAVLGLLLYETFADVSPAQATAIVWIDTAICAVFLLEFFVKFGLANPRGLYFRKHWFIDLLPSIPFALMAHWLASASAIRSLRFLRLPRLLRYVKVARPLIRFVRLFLFLLRGLDRLVRRHAGLLNRSILFCSDPITSQSEREDFTVDLTRLRGHFRRLERSSREQLDLPEQAFLLAERAHSVSHRAQTLDLEREIAREAEPPPTEIDVETVIRRLKDLEPETVIDFAGQDFADQVARSLRFLQMPVVRSLPLIRRLRGPEDSKLTAAQLTASVGRAVGNLLDSLNRRIQWTRDLYGVITGAQFIDKVGTTLVKSAGRPAKRLLMIGALFLLLSAMVHWMGFDGLSTMMEAINRIIGRPLIILGSIALVVFFLGAWMRRVAGSATDFFELVAEAQHIGLTSLIKQARREPDMDFLQRRTVAADERLNELGRARHPRPEEENLRRSRLAGQRAALELMHEDFGRGAPLTHDDTRTTSNLIGNLSIQNLLATRLSIGPKEKKALQGLDLRPGKSNLFGPALWFQLISTAVNQKVAQLVVEYNRHCVPLEDQQQASAFERERLETWLIERRKGMGSRPPEEELASSRQDDEAVPAKRGIWPFRRRRHLSPEERARLILGQSYATTEFKALHFLSTDPERDQLVAERFGEAVCRQMQRDRKALIREVFGANPLEGWSREVLSFNPYRFYLRTMAGGRILWMPLRVVGLGLRTLGFGIKQIHRILRELLDPRLAERTALPARSHYEIAVRKIHRMRKPVYMACLELRAQVDIEYHGLVLPGLAANSLGGDRTQEDLLFIGADPQEIETIAHWARRHRQSLKLMERFLRSLGYSSSDLLALLHERGVSEAGRPAEQLRAAATAFALNRASIRDAAEHVLVLGSNGERKTRAARKRVARSKVCLRKICGETDPTTYVLDALARHARQAPRWSSEIFTMRAVQTLSIVDVDTYKDLVWDLGEYEADGHPRLGNEPEGLVEAFPARSIESEETANVPISEAHT